MRRQRPNASQADRRKLTGMHDLFDRAGQPSERPRDDEFWSVKFVGLKTGLSGASIYKYVDLGLFPRQRRIGAGHVAWRASDVRAWIETRPV